MDINNSSASILQLLSITTVSQLSDSASYCLLRISFDFNQVKIIKMGVRAFFKKRSLKVSDDRVTKAADLTLRESIWPIALVTVLFFLWGFSYGLLDTLNKHFQVTLHIDRARSAGLQAAYFGSVSITVFCLFTSNDAILIVPTRSLLSVMPRGSYDTTPTRLFSSGDSVSTRSAP